MTNLADINSLEETAEYLRIEVPILRRLTVGPTPKISFLRIGRTLTFTREGIEAYVEANITKAAPPHPFGLSSASARRLSRTNAQFKP